MEKQIKVIIEKEVNGQVRAVYATATSPHIDILFAERDEMKDCGSCGGYHRADFTGDCRDDTERFLWIA